MAVIKCGRGHYYDDEKYSECPHCQHQPMEGPRRELEEEHTLFGSAISKEVGAAMRKHMQIDLGGPPEDFEGEKTIGLFRSKKGYDPVVGWLVCTEGKEKGRDFRLHSGRNFIGRALSCDVALAEDTRVSRENHCSLVYDPKAVAFALVRGIGEGVTVEGERLMESRTLTGDEQIVLGESTFVFIPFCKGGRSW